MAYVNSHIWYIIKTSIHSPFLRHAYPSNATLPTFQNPVFSSVSLQVLHSCPLPYGSSFLAAKPALNPTIKSHISREVNKEPLATNTKLLTAGLHTKWSSLVLRRTLISVNKGGDLPMYSLCTTASFWIHTKNGQKYRKRTYTWNNVHRKI